jgi:hypothetical protein
MSDSDRDALATRERCPRCYPPVRRQRSRQKLVWLAIIGNLLGWTGLALLYVAMVTHSDLAGFSSLGLMTVALPFLLSALFESERTGP